MMEPGRQEQHPRTLAVSAREEERRRWARELHDDTLQSLGALRVQLSAARRSDELDGMREALDGAVQELDREIANLRALIAELRPAALDELGLEAALGSLFERTAGVHKLSVRASVVLAGARHGRLDTEIETTIYRVVQESLTNAARHAQASEAQVMIRETRGEVTIMVADDGRGFDPELDPRGFGLAGMEERLALVGGRIRVRSSAQGTVVQASVPAARAEAPRPMHSGRWRGRRRALLPVRTGISAAH